MTLGQRSASLSSVDMHTYGGRAVLQPGWPWSVYPLPCKKAALLLVLSSL